MAENINIVTKIVSIVCFSIAILIIILGKNPISGGSDPRVSIINNRLMEDVMFVTVCLFSLKKGMAVIKITL